MKEYIVDSVLKLNEDITDIELFAAVSDTMSEVVFYCVCGGTFWQSNQMAETDIIDPYLLDCAYRDIAAYIRQNELFRSSHLNVVTYSERADALNWHYYEKGTSVNTLLKGWKPSMRKK